MCGISGILSPDEGATGFEPRDLSRRLAVMNRLQRHRGPDGEGIWRHPAGRVGFGHVRLSIIDLDAGRQPMQLPPAGDTASARPDESGACPCALCVTFNGEIYNYLELREELGPQQFHTQSDTETILHAWHRWGEKCVQHLRGMFAFALWDDRTQTLFCARDRFGIKPFYYTTVDGALYFASEAKALLPFLPEIKADPHGLRDYLTFQFYLEGKTLFAGIRELPPAHCLTVRNGRLDVRRYWDVEYDWDRDRTARFFRGQIRALMNDSVGVHLRSDVPVGSYLSGGLDSSIVSALASHHSPQGYRGYTGKFTDRPGFDESGYARAVAEHSGFPLDEIDIRPQHFTDHLRTIIYHLDMPVAGPGSFPQFMVSELASRKHKVVLGGQGGDEIFGGYTRYLIAYLEHCLKNAVDGTPDEEELNVPFHSLLASLRALKTYKPLLRHFWSDGLFDAPHRRYFRLINRAPLLGDKVRWELFDDYDSAEPFSRLFNAENVYSDSAFDRVTHADFKTLLPALLHVEDRVSMAHGLESRVPFIDHPLVEAVARIPACVKFKDGMLKNILKECFADVLPGAITARKDKMGFPVPLNDWIAGPAAEFVNDVFASQRALSREYVDNARVRETLSAQNRFDRTLWGLLSLEIWQQAFVDRQAEFRALRDQPQELRGAA